MKPSEEHWNRWVDGEFRSPEERIAIEKEMADSSDREFFSRLSTDLKEIFPAELEPPAADFFNSQIQKRLRELDAQSSKETRVSLGALFGSWLRKGWMIPATAAVVLSGVLLYNSDFFATPVEGSQIVHTFTPDASLTVETTYNASANATVVRLGGMEDLPDDYDLKLTRAGETEQAKVAVELQIQKSSETEESEFTSVVALH